MKGLKLVIVLVGLGFFGIQNMDAQQKKLAPVEINEQHLKRVTEAQLPAKVQQATTMYAGYSFKKAFVSQQKNNATIYKVLIARGPIEYTLIIDEKGKVLAMNE